MALTVPPQRQAEAAAPCARALGREPAGTCGTRDWFALLGSELESQGAAGGCDITAALSQYFVTEYWAMTLLQVRGVCNHQTLGSAMEYAAVPAARRDRIMRMIADYLALEFVTPVAASSTLAPQPEADENSGRGGLKTARFRDVDELSIGCVLSAQGRLCEPHVHATDFAHLQLPILLKPKHKSAILLIAVEMTAVHQDNLYTDELYEEEIGNQLTKLFGPCPQTKKSKAAAVLSYAQLGEEAEAELGFTWQHGFADMIRNIRSKKEVG